MSEIKGTILGILLTMVLFGTVSGILTAAFTIYNNQIKQEVKKQTGEDVVVTNEFLHYQD